MGRRKAASRTGKPAGRANNGANLGFEATLRGAPDSFRVPMLPPGSNSLHRVG